VAVVVVVVVLILLVFIGSVMGWVLLNVKKSIPYKN
jgi:hypothetical protein